MGSGGKVSGSEGALNGAAGAFGKKATAVAKLVEQVRSNRHVSTGDGSLDGLIGGLVSAIVASMGEFGENGVQAGATLLEHQAKNFHKAGRAAQPAR